MLSILAALASAAPTVILLSWDGMRHDYLDADYPNLTRLGREGVRAGRLTPVYPSNTFPGHVSLATGAPPEVHGILDNRMWDRERGAYAYESDASWLDAEPLWIAAERQGVTAATYFWVGSETDWHEQRATYRMAPFDGGRPEAAKVDKIIEWLSLPTDRRPGLIMSYWGGADSPGHRNGPADPSVREAIARQDKELGRLLRFLDDEDRWQETTVMIVSDHGMTPISQGINITDIIDDSGIVTRIAGRGAVSHVFLRPDADPAGLASALRAVPELEVHTSNHPLLTHPSRSGDLIVTTTPPNAIVYNPDLTAALTRYIADLIGYSKGGHGYDPALPDMGGIFLAMGRGVQTGKPIREFRQLDVAATVCDLLGIEPPLQSAGNVVQLD